MVEKKKDKKIRKKNILIVTNNVTAPLSVVA
jgi:hypothetical protein